MSSSHEEWEGALTVLTVREGEATVRDFHFDCRGETSCRAELSELVQLLERRRADLAIFISHPNLAGPLMEELRRRGKHVPEMVIAPPAGGAPPAGASVPASGGQTRLTVSLSLSGLSEVASPQEILSRLYQALRSAQGLAAEQAGSLPPQWPAVGGAGQGASAGLNEGTAARASEAGEVPEATDTATCSAPGERLAPGGDDSQAGAASSRPQRAVATEAGPDREAARSNELDELSARLERILDRRLGRA